MLRPVQTACGTIWNCMYLDMKKCCSVNIACSSIQFSKLKITEIELVLICHDASLPVVHTTGIYIKWIQTCMDTCVHCANIIKHVL